MIALGLLLGALLFSAAPAAAQPIGLGIQVAQASPAQRVLTWDAVPGATRYEVLGCAATSTCVPFGTASGWTLSRGCVSATTTCTISAPTVVTVYVAVAYVGGQRLIQTKMGAWISP